jgi:hypothetical protein
MSVNSVVMSVTISATTTTTTTNRFVFTSSCLYEGWCLIYAICVCLLILVSNTHCVVFYWFFFVLCTQCCQYLWIVHFWLPLWYSLTFIYCKMYMKPAVEFPIWHRILDWLNIYIISDADILFGVKFNEYIWHFRSLSPSVWSNLCNILKYIYGKLSPLFSYFPPWTAISMM